MAAFDVGEADFEQRVVERSREVPVVVDFWAAWCAPCRTLTPILEREVAAREGAVELAKVDVDQNQRLAARFGVQGIPAVKAFRDGAVAAEFTGALPPAQVATFLDELVPSEADELVARGDEDALRRALELEPGRADAAVALARILLGRGEAQAALELVEPLAGTDFAASGLAARAALMLSGEAPEEACAALAGGDHERALELLQSELAAASDPERRDLLRRVRVGLFAELGPASELAATHRRRLAAALN